ADMAYISAGAWRTTAKRRPPGGELTPTERTGNRALSAARAPVERGMARLKSWQIFRRSRISPNRMTVIAKAVLTLESQH
ncbi:transposase family protein, partial [Streptomyces sp. NPDC004074]|uniref:transposase family protein n=1 Tax=unclassified Streptomyces TaxID=2593676 RepID=UPI0033BD4CA7